MEKEDRVDVQELVGACARIALFVADELEPVSIDVAERDLDSLYELAVAGERALRRWQAQREGRTA